MADPKDRVFKDEAKLNCVAAMSSAAISTGENLAPLLVLRDGGGEMIICCAGVLLASAMAAKNQTKEQVMSRVSDVIDEAWDRVLESRAKTRN